MITPAQKMMRTYPILGLMTTLWLAGCGGGNQAPEAVSLSAAPGAVRGAFDTAKPDLKKAADEAGQALADGAYDVSLGRIAELSARQDLSAEQRQALAQSRVAVMKKLQEAAAAGDARSGQIMEMHRATK